MPGKKPKKCLALGVMVGRMPFTVIVHLSIRWLQSTEVKSGLCCMAKAMISFSLCGDSWNQADSSVEGGARSCAQLTPLRLMNAWCNAWYDSH